MSFIPEPQKVEVLVPGKPVKDRFGNERPGVGVWEPLQVASWWVDRSEEKSEDSVLRTVDMLHVHVPVGHAISAASKVRLPDGSEWAVEGSPEDYNHGWHGWAPGLLVIHAKKVEG